jgi:hypothetical protein
MGNGPGSQLSPILRIDYRDRYLLPATRARGWIALNFAKHNQGVLSNGCRCATTHEAIEYQIALIRGRLNQFPKKRGRLLRWVAGAVGG